MDQLPPPIPQQPLQLHRPTRQLPPHLQEEGLAAQEDLAARVVQQAQAVESARQSATAVSKVRWVVPVQQSRESTAVQMLELVLSELAVQVMVLLWSMAQRVRWL